MSNKLIINKFTLIIVTRCNLRCKLCCEYVPQNKPFSDMTIAECREILTAFFTTIDYLTTLHLSGGGEPFLHPDLAKLIEECMVYSTRFDRLMLFTNSMVFPNEELLKMLHKFKDKVIIQISHYGINPRREEGVLVALKETGAKLKVEKYYGDDQSFGGWVDFGEWIPQGRSSKDLNFIFNKCAITCNMRGNWRTRDGKVHWCSRSQRGMELGLVPDNPDDYVNLLDSSSIEEKREKFKKVESTLFLAACDYCSGDAGTENDSKRYPAAEQL